MDISRLSLTVGIFSWLLQYFPNNRAISVQQKWKGEENNCQNPLREELFFAASLIQWIFGEIRLHLGTENESIANERHRSFAMVSLDGGRIFVFFF